MPNYFVHRNGELISVGTVLADPLPKGLAAVELSDEKFAAYISGHGVWNEEFRDVDVFEKPVEVTLETRLAKLETSLVTKGVLTAEEVDVKVVKRFGLLGRPVVKV